MGQLTLTRGDSATIVETVGPAGLTDTGIAGWLFYLAAREDPSDTTAVFSKGPTDFTIQDSGSATTAAIVSVQLAPTDTAALPPWQTTLQYDVRATDGTGHVYTLDSGTLIIAPNIAVPA